MKRNGKSKSEEFFDKERLSEEQNKRLKKKKKRKQSNSLSLKEILSGFNNQQTKNNIQNTLLKLIADIAGVGMGTVFSASAGKVAPAVGIALMGAGHYMGDESGLLRIVGASTLSHGVAKSKEYREKPEMSIKERLKDVKDDWLYAFLFKKYTQEHEKEINSDVQVNEEGVHVNGIEIYDREPEFLEESEQDVRQNDDQRASSEEEHIGEQPCIKKKQVSNDDWRGKKKSHEHSKDQDPHVAFNNDDFPDLSLI